MTSKELSPDRFAFNKKMSSKGIREQFLGFDNQTHLPVVIETLHDSFKNDQDSNRAIESEVEVTRRLKSPYFVEFIGCFVKDEKKYYVYNFVDAEPISNASFLSSLSARDICSFISKSVKAIAFAHSLGVIHGALSSDSILITPSNEPVIIGFNELWVEPITDPGIVHGVSQYQCAAPELFQGVPIDASCDFYALGRIAKYIFEVSIEKRSDPKPIESLEIVRAKEIIFSLCSLERQHRYSAAQLLIDPEFLGSMATPPQGNAKLNLSKKELKKIRKNLRRDKTQLRKPMNDQTRIALSLGLKIIAIIFAGMVTLLLILRFG